MTPAASPVARPLPPPVVTAGGHAPFVELVRSRLIEFCREPEALFWVYGFPLVMILSLGIAFRQQPLASLSVDIVAGPHAEADAAALASAAGLTATIRPQADALERLRTGRGGLGRGRGGGRGGVGGGREGWGGNLGLGGPVMPEGHLVYRPYPLPDTPPEGPHTLQPPLSHPRETQSKFA